MVFDTFYKYKNDVLTIHKEHLSYLLIDALNEHHNISKIYDSSELSEQFQNAYNIGGMYNFLILWFSHNMSESVEEITRIC